jgi:PAS domain-containing protein
LENKFWGGLSISSNVKDGERERLILELKELREKAEANTKKMHVEMITLQEKIYESEAFSRSILDSLTTNIAVLNESGFIINVNKAWIDFALQNRVTSLDKVNIGANYFDVCKKAHGDHSEESSIALNGLLSIINGNDLFELEYPCDSLDEKRWFLMRATGFYIKNHRYIVVNHINITDRKLAEDALLKSYQELENRIKMRKDKTPE